LRFRGETGIKPTVSIVTRRLSLETSESEKGKKSVSDRSVCELPICSRFAI
jgi:hypothetical protein